MRRYRLHLLGLLWLVGVVTAGCYSADSVLADTAAPKRLDEILHWLPPDTETIVVANGPFKLEKPRHDEFSHVQQAIEGLPSLNLRGLMPKELVGKKVVLAVEGSRCFRPPRRLGMGPYQGCEVVVFEEDAAPSLPVAMRSLEKEARRTMELSGMPVAVFEEKWEEDTWTLYVTQPRPGILLCATDEGYLKDVLRGMKERLPTRAMPQDIPAWKHVNTESRVWAIRHFSIGEAAKDPSSPLKDEAAESVPDLGAVGITFSYEPDTKRATIRHLTRAKDAEAIAPKDAEALARRGWFLPPNEKFRTTFIEPGVDQITITIDDDVGQTFLLVLLLQLGYVVHL